MADDTDRIAERVWEEISGGKAIEHYSVDVSCWNCNFRGVLTFAKGKQVTRQPCPKCGFAGLAADDPHDDARMVDFWDEISGGQRNPTPEQSTVWCQM